MSAPARSDESRFQSELGFSAWVPTSPLQIGMVEKGVTSLNIPLDGGMAFIHVHPAAQRTDAALQVVLDEFLSQMAPAPGQKLRPVKIQGADSAFAITVQSEAMGVTIPGELRAARRENDLVVFGVMSVPESAPAKRFLDSFAFTERGVYIDPIQGFRVAISPAWEFEPQTKPDDTIVLARQNRSTRQSFTVRRFPMKLEASPIEKIGESIATAMQKEGSKQLALRTQLLKGRKTIDLWWQELHKGRSFISGVRTLVLSEFTLAGGIASADVTEITPASQAMLDSFQPQ